MIYLHRKVESYQQCQCDAACRMSWFFIKEQISNYYREICYVFLIELVHAHVPDIIMDKGHYS